MHLEQDEEKKVCVVSASGSRAAMLRDAKIAGFNSDAGM
jgi:hypothetical protein